MGLGHTSLNLLYLLHEHGLLGTKEKVADFGAQAFRMSEAEYDVHLRNFCRLRGGELPDVHYEPSDRLNGPTSTLYSTIGWSSTCFDLDERFNSVRIDFNYDDIPGEYAGQYSITTNFGTSEHVFNQANFFRLQHNLTKPDGLMIHVLPLHEFVNHGLFCYCPTLFHSLAKYNDYEVMGIWKNFKPNFHHFEAAEPPFQGHRMVLVSVLRKRKDTPFKLPLQVNEPMFPAPEAEARYSAFVREDLSVIGHEQTLPREFWVDLSNSRLSYIPVGLKRTKEEKESEKELARMEKLKNRIEKLEKRIVELTQ